MNDEKIIVALLSNPTVAEAADSLGISPQTIYNKLRNDTFREQYSKARMQVLQEDCFRLQSYVSDAVEAIHEMIVDKCEKSQIKLNAADALLRHTYRLTELTDIIERIEKLEEQMKGDN